MLYPALDRILGGNDPTGPRAGLMWRSPIRSSVWASFSTTSGPDGPDEEDVAELRRLLYGLNAKPITRLMTWVRLRYLRNVGSELLFGSGTHPRSRWEAGRHSAAP